LLDEGFEQERVVTVLELPVGGDLPGGASQYVILQTGRAKTAV
jgi:hypothetical protein